MTTYDRKITPNSQREAWLKLDGRGKVARRLRALREDLIESLGGPDVVTAQQRILIESLAVRVIRCRMLTAEMVNHGLSLEGERRLNWHLASIRRDVLALGLDRHTGKAPSLAEHMAGKGAP